jgi:hypothetical protein
MPVPNSAAVALDARNSAEGMRTRMPLAVRKDIVRLRREQIEAERHVQHPTLSDVRNDSRRLRNGPRVDGTRSRPSSRSIEYAPTPRSSVPSSNPALDAGSRLTARADSEPPGNFWRLFTLSSRLRVTHACQLPCGHLPHELDHRSLPSIHSQCMACGHSGPQAQKDARDEPGRPRRRPWN